MYTGVLYIFKQYYELIQEFCLKENMYERCRLEVALMTCHLKFNVQLEKVMLFT